MHTMQANVHQAAASSYDHVLGTEDSFVAENGDGWWGVGPVNVNTEKEIEMNSKAFWYTLGGIVLCGVAIAVADWFVACPSF